VFAIPLSGIKKQGKVGCESCAVWRAHEAFYNYRLAPKWRNRLCNFIFLFLRQPSWFQFRDLLSLFLNDLLQTPNIIVEATQGFIRILSKSLVDFFVSGNMTVCLAMGNPEKTGPGEKPDKSPEAIDSIRRRAWNHTATADSREEQKDKRPVLIDQISPTEKWSFTPLEAFVIGAVLGLITGSLLLYWFLTQNGLLAGN
jgi:hypothetical protein